ncbi:hypothetical protein BP6252_05874 [Coleophoma cylindrospora]|uniref:Carboxylic ester hydrolase n=1 Tax=Coleophoma cylindrospora TaxID=1849047 RepID=A0A3D8RVI7_9HELO|nr:hypothetical protein BP6252_05874 [Coleophoma cylindrospora]
MLAPAVLIQLLSLTVGIVAVPTAVDSNGLLINTTSGNVQGFINETAPDVRQFLGIPYAEPPIGALRFAPPRVKSPEKTVINATALPASCMQQFSNSSTIYTAVVNQFLINGGQSEDCLYVSVWAPSIQSVRDAQGPLPVFVYIPGGGFTSGGQNSLYKIPDQWVQQSQAHIVIVMNYRVNLFGYPNAKGLKDRNPGLLDQRLAVEWAKANVAAFGGDSSRIILWGQSAGATSVTDYAYAYPQDPIVAGLIADSGSPTTLSNSDYAQTNFTSLANLVGCAGLSGADEVACMRQVPATDLENALSYHTINGTKPALAFTPVADNITVFSNFTDRAERGLIARIPLITGSNSNEGAGFVPYTPDGPGTAALFAATESIIACGVAAEVLNRHRIGLLTYRYQYTGNFTNVSPVSWFGAYHSAELPLLFGTHYEFRGNSTPFEYSVSHAMQAFWLSFAENPGAAPRWLSPEKELFTWAGYDPTRASMALFASDNEIVQWITSDRIDSNCTSL